MILAYHEYQKGKYLISTDPARLDIAAIHAFLTRAYWSEGIPKEIVERAVQNSLCFGVYDIETQKQIGLARLVTDLTTYAYICDVYILEQYRGQGLSKWLMECVKSYPDLQGLRRWSLVTRDAHELYRQFGFVNLVAPERYMEITRPNIYKQP